MISTIVACGVDAKDNPLHQADIGVTQAEVRSQRDNRASHSGGVALEKLGAEYGNDDEHGPQDDGRLKQSLLHPATGPIRGLTAAEDASARIPHLQQDHYDEYHGDQYLRKIQRAFQLRFPSQADRIA